jgi:TatD DNase family protein
MNEIIDSHAHLAWESFGPDLEEVIERARLKNVVQIVQAGVDFESIPQMIALALRYPHIFFGVGLHPHEAKHWDSSSASVLKEAASNPKNVAIGECGLDFHYNFSERQQQLLAFQAQVKLARELGKPLIIHTRDAWEDTFAILHEEGKGNVRGVFHCFTGGPEVLPEIAKLDFYVSFSGVLTFKNAQAIQMAAPLVPANRIMVETDCPYLSPIPLRGKRNEPANIWHTASKLAELRDVSTDKIAAATTENTRRLFGLPS